MSSDSGPVILLTAALNEQQLARVREAAPGARIVREGDLAADPDLVRRIEIAYPRLPSVHWPRAESLRWL